MHGGERGDYFSPILLKAVIYIAEQEGVKRQTEFARGTITYKSASKLGHNLRLEVIVYFIRLFLKIPRFRLNGHLENTLLASL